ncbi:MULTISPECIES: LysR family transcriptional regulator [Tabrizicola]|uniref:LysR family transcriptional regulator n=1 Tax=Tabrizicola TaxID=1443919 RepID=UPI001081269A|nr:MULTISPECIES: LysR family transcriptional regulator [Paracoccaceae]
MVNFATFDLNLLRVLDCLLREGSTIRAGQKLGLSQSAVSGALGRLRQALDDPLFVRQGNRLVATERAARMAEPLQAELERLQALLSPEAPFRPDTATGAFKIAGSDFFAEMLMPELGARLGREAPGVTVQLVDLVPSDYLASIDQRGADLALLPERPVPDWMVSAPAFTSSFVVISRSGNPALADLAEGATIPIDRFCALSHVLFSPEGRLSGMGDAALARVGRSRRIAITVPLFSAVCRVVSESDLVALVPRQLAERVRASHRLEIRLPPVEIAPAQMIGVWHRRTDRSPFAAWMRNLVFDLLSRI